MTTALLESSTDTRALHTIPAASRARQRSVAVPQRSGALGRRGEVPGPGHLGVHPESVHSVPVRACSGTNARRHRAESARVGDRNWWAGVVLGIALAIGVAVIGLVGAQIEHTVTTPERVGTTAIAAHRGEPLSDLASRVSAAAPTARVLAEIRDLNHFDATTTVVASDEAVLVPVYR